MKSILVKPDSSYLSTFTKKTKGQTYQDVNDEYREEILFSFFISTNPEISYNISISQYRVYKKESTSFLFKKEVTASETKITNVSKEEVVLAMEGSIGFLYKKRITREKTFKGYTLDIYPGEISILRKEDDAVETNLLDSIIDYEIGDDPRYFESNMVKTDFSFLISNVLILKLMEILELAELKMFATSFFVSSTGFDTISRDIKPTPVVIQAHSAYRRYNIYKENKNGKMSSTTIAPTGKQKTPLYFFKTMEDAEEGYFRLKNKAKENIQKHIERCANFKNSL